MRKSCVLLGMEDNLACVRFEDKVWQLAIAPTGEILVETRSLQKRTIRFFKLDTSLEKKTLHLQVTQWMSHLLAFDKEVAYFQVFHDANDPNNLSLECYDVANGEKIAASAVPQNERVLSPLKFEEKEPHFSLTKDLLGEEIVGLVEYWEQGEHMVISYYQNNNQKLDRYLIVYSGGEQKVKILQDHGMTGISPEAFCIFEDQIIFIKNVREVCRIRL